MAETKTYSPPGKGRPKARKALFAVQAADTLMDLLRLAGNVAKRASLERSGAMKDTFFGATLADMDLTKLGLSLQGVMDTLKGVDPTYYGIAAGGALGGLGTAAATDPDLPFNALTFTLVSPPEGMTIDAASGGIAWTPGEVQGPTNYVITVQVTDNSPEAVNEQHLSDTSDHERIQKPGDQGQGGECYQGRAKLGPHVDLLRLSAGRQARDR